MSKYLPRRETRIQRVLTFNFYIKDDKFTFQKYSDMHQYLAVHEGNPRLIHYEENPIIFRGTMREILIQFQRSFRIYGRNFTFVSFDNFINLL